MAKIPLHPAAPEKFKVPDMGIWHVTTGTLDDQSGRIITTFDGFEVAAVPAFKPDI